MSNPRWMLTFRLWILGGANYHFVVCWSGLDMQNSSKFHVLIRFEKLGKPRAHNRLCAANKKTCEHERNYLTTCMNIAIFIYLAMMNQDSNKSWRASISNCISASRDQSHHHWVEQHTTIPNPTVGKADSNWNTIHLWVFHLLSVDPSYPLVMSN